MNKAVWFIPIMSLFLTACGNETPPVTHSEPVAVQPEAPAVEIDGIEPVYEAPVTAANQDYQQNGTVKQIVRDPTHYSNSGLADTFGEEARGQRTNTGEELNPDTFTAVHATLPLPGYVRVTNLANRRQLVVRLNGRAPLAPDRIIGLSAAAADRLNLNRHTRVQVDYIHVAPDGTLSGPGTQGTVVAKKSYALPSRPDLSNAGDSGYPVISPADAIGNVVR